MLETKKSPELRSSKQKDLYCISRYQSHVLIRAFVWPTYSAGESHFSVCKISVVQCQNENAVPLHAKSIKVKMPHIIRNRIFKGYGSQMTKEVDWKSSGIKEFIYLFIHFMTTDHFVLWLVRTFVVLLRVLRWYQDTIAVQPLFQHTSAVLFHE